MEKKIMAWWDHEELKNIHDRSDRWWEEFGKVELPDHYKFREEQKKMKAREDSKELSNNQKPEPIYPHNSEAYKKALAELKASEHDKAMTAENLKKKIETVYNSRTNGIKESFIAPGVLSYGAHSVFGPNVNEENLSSTNEGRKFDADKPRYDLIPPELDEAVAKILAFGAKKYGDRNWENGFNWGRASAALQRHMNAWSRGEDKDPETGMSHLWHAACNITFLIAFEARNVGIDDRAPHFKKDKK